MRKIVGVILGLLIIVSAPVFAATINVSGRAGLYNSPGGASTSMMYGLAADYSLNPDLSVRGAVETTSYIINNVQTTYTPVSLDLIYSQTVSGMFHPYVGAGVSYNTANTGGVVATSSGAQAEAGIRFDLEGFSAGIEYRYMIPDLSRSNSSSLSYNAYATGAFTQSFNL
jgi:opacity protein-like surface antigen